MRQKKKAGCRIGRRFHSAAIDLCISNTHIETPRGPGRALDSVAVFKRYRLSRLRKNSLQRRFSEALYQGTTSVVPQSGFR